MELILFVVEVVSIFHQRGVGGCARFANGEGGVPSFPTLPSYVISSLPTMTQHTGERISSTQKRCPQSSAQSVDAVVIVLDRFDHFLILLNLLSLSFSLRQ